MARLAPRRSQAAHLSGLPAVASTVTPNAEASWIAVVPMPEEPPWTRKLSPGWRRPRSKTLVQTVKKVSGMAPASTIGRVAGAGRGWGAGGGAELGVPAARHQRHHAVADPPALDVGPDGHHLARDLEPG